MIVWSESMSTGDRRLDVQHQMLIQKFNELTEIIASGDTAESRLAAADVLDFLQFYATWHFKQEEDCMERYQCPVAAVNQRAHREFLSMFGAFYTSWQEGNMDMVLAQQTHDHLANWIITHIVNIDTQLRPCVHKA